MTDAILPEMDATAIKVLLVEDCRLVRVGIRSVLDQNESIEVVGEVDSGESAVVMAANLHPDIVLIDLGLPGISGVETIRQIKAMPSVSCRFVVLTSHETEEEVWAAMAAGASAFCLKNISSHRLSEVIATVNEGATWLDPAIAGCTQRLFTQTRAQGGPESALRNQLSERELSILALLVEGKSNIEIAQTLFISVHTAKFYVSSLLEKLGVSDRVQAAVKAIREGLV